MEKCSSWKPTTESPLKFPMDISPFQTEMPPTCSQRKRKQIGEGDETNTEEGMQATTEGEEAVPTKGTTNKSKISQASSSKKKYKNIRYVLGLCITMD